MYRLSHKIFLTTFAIAVVPLCLPSEWKFSLESAQASQLYQGTIEFYGNDPTTVVGTGSFSFDKDSSTFVETDMAPIPSGFFVNTALSNFGANLIGYKWTLGSKTWWSDGSRTPGYQAVSRSSINIRQKTWFFGDPFLGQQQLTMNFSLFSDTDGSGTWLGQIVNNSGPPTTGSGTWKATVIPIANIATIPEPLTILGAVAASGFGALFKRKLAQFKEN